MGEQRHAVLRTATPAHDERDCSIRTVSALRLETGRARWSFSSGSPWDHTRLHRQQTLSLQLFARELAGAADGFGPLPDSLLGRLLVMAAEFHLAEDALTLHFSFQR